MDKVGIITFHNAHNYGATLQVYALQKTLNNMGFDAKVINYNNKIITNQYKLIKYSKKNPIKCVKLLYKSFKNYKNNKMRYIKFEDFINNKLKLTKEYENLESDFPKMDCYITGSDQVWNLDIVGELSNAYTLNFGEEKTKRISYAASVGDALQIRKNNMEFKKKIENLDYISVREEDAKDELQNIIKKPIEVVLDPTLLLKQEDWNKEILVENKEKEKYILAYVVEADAEYIKIVNDLSKKTGLKIIHFELINPGYNNVLKSAYTEGPLEFINYIKNAEYIVATSFHATVFSIIFNKKFFIIPHKKTGARVTNLLNKLEIRDRIFHNLDDFENINYDLEINWELVNKKLEKEREKSLEWLNKAINS